MPICKYRRQLDILWGESGQNTDMDYVLALTLLEAEIAGVTVKRLKPEMAFLSLCLHHYKDMNSIYLLYKGSLAALSFSAIFIMPSKFVPGLGRFCSSTANAYPSLPICILVYYANEVFDDPDLADFLESWKGYRD